MAIDKRFIFLIAQAQNRLFTSLDRALSEAAGITAAQSGALYYLLDHDGCPLNELSRALLLDKSAVTGLVDRLEGKGLVERRRTSPDRRAINVYLTEAGRAASMRCLKVTRKFNEAVTEGLSEQEVKAFSKALKGIIHRFPRQDQGRKKDNNRG